MSVNLELVVVSLTDDGFEKVNSALGKQLRERGVRNDDEREQCMDASVSDACMENDWTYAPIPEVWGYVVSMERVMHAEDYVAYNY